MPKFRFLLWMEDGDIWGTNDADEAVEAAEQGTDLVLVVDTETSEVLLEYGGREAIDQYIPPPAEGEDDEDD